ncbi:Uncharacterised protein [Streptococcus pneumoniae]|uniref:hypothetical protein n=1 Tax=Streptococcus pneumoniae TaxID=1313 RepID=UPI0005DE6CF2|nr:hypothetical protein [Streptococcus pneumoniae]WIA45653.1 hypothetical protein ODS73_11040 [Streptococcus pneumoniae]CGF51252.1 Uncharacterised protein [Streptococcus pneumoniae]CIO12978.1 Uncharacterised protein [Streptococcus pneumoniae]CIO64054.1 Uncharacterised protein [Streptococcus pneumoniae]CIP47079.1 Uncharacterised protein [Streptococcus pneumoniae]
MPKLLETEKYSLDSIIDGGKLRMISKFCPDLHGLRYEFKTSDSITKEYCKKIRQALRDSDPEGKSGKKCMMRYTIDILNVWNTLCRTRDFITGSLKADDVIENVKINHKSLVRNVDEENIESISKEIPKGTDMYYYVLYRLGLNRIKYNYLVKALAGAIQKD